MVATYTAAKAVGITSIDAYLFPCKLFYLSDLPFYLHFTEPLW